MRVASYLRVSRDDQSLDLQRDAVDELVSRRKWKLAREFSDQGISGSHDRRPGLQALLAAVRARRRAFDVVVVYRSDRLFRSLRELVITLDELAALGVGFVSTSEPFDTTSSAGRLLVHLVGAFAEFERAVLIERTVAGVAAARKRGVAIGRPRVVVDVLEARRLRHARPPMSYAAIAKRLGVGVGTVHRALR